MVGIKWERRANTCRSRTVVLCK